MIFLRDIIIFAGLMALAATVISSLLPVDEGVSAVPTCSDCAFKLAGEYRITQHDNYAVLYLGTKEVARYGWAFVNGRPLRVDESISCNPMYLWVFSGIVYISCDGDPPKIGRRIGISAPAVAVDLQTDSTEENCVFYVKTCTNTASGAPVGIYIYDENSLLLYLSGVTSGELPFSAPGAGVYRAHIYVSSLVDERRYAYATI